jgi:hypothetical protein
MPLSKNDPALDYDGSWGDASKGWPAISFDTEEEANRAYVIAHREVKVPYGSYVLVGNVLRLETEGWKAKVSARLGRPRIVCLCGSTRFYEAFMRANYEETMAGHIVLSVGFFMHRPDTAHGEALGCTPEQKVALDALHKQKIDLSNEVLILNVGGYIGDSTRSELEYARKQSKPVRWLETPAEPRAVAAIGGVAPYGTGTPKPIPTAPGICTYCNAPRSQCSPFSCREH